MSSFQQSEKIKSIVCPYCRGSGEVEKTRWGPVTGNARGGFSQTEHVYIVECGVCEGIGRVLVLYIIATEVIRYKNDFWLQFPNIKKTLSPVTGVYTQPTPISISSQQKHSCDTCNATGKIQIQNKVPDRLYPSGKVKSYKVEIKHEKCQRCNGTGEIVTTTYNYRFAIYSPDYDA